MCAYCHKRRKVPLDFSHLAANMKCWHRSPMIAILCVLKKTYSHNTIHLPLIEKPLMVEVYTCENMSPWQLFTWVDKQPHTKCNLKPGRSQINYLPVFCEPVVLSIFTSIANNQDCMRQFMCTVITLVDATFVQMEGVFFGVDGSWDGTDCGNCVL